MPAPFRNVFSSTRSWAIARARAFGATAAPSQFPQRVGGDVLEFEGDDLRHLRQGGQGGRVVVVGNDRAGGDP